MTGTTFTGRATDEISFPLGGIGTGSIGLAGNGRLIDWEIFGHPNKGSDNGHTHFAVKAERDGKLLDARVLCGDVFMQLDALCNLALHCKNRIQCRHGVLKNHGDLLTADTFHFML